MPRSAAIPGHLRVAHAQHQVLQHLSSTGAMPLEPLFMNTGISARGWRWRRTRRPGDQ
jgi:hypothetical protein